jgi:peroxiredoxin
MKPINFILLILAFNLQSTGQTNIQIILKNPDQHKIDKVDAFDQSQQEIYTYKFKDTLLLKFKKTNIDFYNIRYHENGKMFRKQVWLDTGNIKIEAHIADDKLIIDTVINSPFYYEAEASNDQYIRVSKQGDSVALNNFLLAVIEKNLDNPFSIHIGYYYVMLNQRSRTSLLKLKALLDKQGDKFSWFLIYPGTVERMNKILSGDKIELANYSFRDRKNKKTKIQLTGADYYVLDFWFLACPPCLRDHIVINKKIAALKNKGVELISISTDDNVKKWNAYLTKHGYNWPNYLENKKSSITDDLSLAGFPTYLVINNKGDIIDIYNSFSGVLKKFGIEE